MSKQKPTLIEFKKILDFHKKWLNNEKNGVRANLTGADLTGADLTGANLTGADLTGASLSGASLTGANLTGADLTGAFLSGASLTGANLTGADLTGADLTGANLARAFLSGADLTGANLTNTKGMAKIMGVLPGNYYYKRFEVGLNNNGYQYKIGLNKLRKGEVFFADERICCSFPGFHFASKSWCALYYFDRPYEALIRIPKQAKVNEPWATDGKASADMIEIIKVWETKTGKDVTRKFKTK